MKDILKLLPYIIISVLLVFIFLSSRSCNLPFINKGGEDSVKRDTVVVWKTIKGETVTVTETEFKPVYIENEVNKDLLAEVEKLKDDKERISFLLNELRTKVYDTTYTIEGRGKLSIKDSIQGNLLGREWSMTFDDFTYPETTITNTITKYPNFAISLGLDTGVKTNFTIFEEPFIGANVGFRNRNGYELMFRYNTLEQVSIGLKKDIFVHYRR